MTKYYSVSGAARNSQTRNEPNVYYFCSGVLMDHWP